LNNSVKGKKCPVQFHAVTITLEIKLLGFKERTKSADRESEGIGGLYRRVFAVKREENNGLSKSTSKKFD
jgi:hypothetical protein